MSAHMSMAHPRWRDLRQKSEQYNSRLNTLRQRYAMHEATHAEYGVIRARNLKRALQTLKNRSRLCDKRNKQFVGEFKAMEERAQHVETVSFAKAALERSKEDFSRVLAARRPQWQKQTMRAKKKRLEKLKKEKEKLKAHRLRSAQLFKDEMELNETLAKKREETNILHAEFRREELERQLKAEKELNFQERERRQREQKLAAENDKLRAELEMLTTQREDAKRQHEMKLEAMREEEQRVLIEAGTKRFQEDQRKSADQIRLLKERQQRQQDEQQKKLQEVLNKSQTLRQPPIESVGMKSNTAVTKAPIMQSTSVQDENLAIQQRMQDKMEAEMTLRKFRQEALRVEQEHKVNSSTSSSLSQSRNTNINNSNTSDGNDSSLNASNISTNNAPQIKPVTSYNWNDWVNVMDLLVQHIQRDQNASTLKLGYGNADRAWGQVFLQATSDQRQEWISMAYSASEENMGSRARREMGKMGMVKWCTAICEVLRCVTEKGIINANYLQKYMNANGNDGLSEAMVEEHMASFQDTRIEVWQSFVAHLKYLMEKCNLSPMYLSRTFAVYLTPNDLQRMEYADRTLANLLLKVLVPPPKASPSRTSLMARTGLGSLTDIDNSFNQQSSKAVETISKVSPRKLSPLNKSPSNNNNSKSTTKKKINVLDRVRQGYSFGSDDFDDDDDDDDLSLNNMTGGSFFNNTSINRSNNTSLKKNPSAGSGSSMNSASTSGDTSNDKDKKKESNVSDVVEIEEYDSFDDDF